MKTYLVCVSLLVGIGAGGDAFADCSNHNSCFERFRDLIQQVAIIGKVDNRFTYDDYKLAKNNMFKVDLTQGQVHSLSGGTGAFYCGGAGGSANLVLRDNLLLLDAHTFLKYSDPARKNCIGRLSDAELAKCQFRTIDGNGKMSDHPYFIDPSSLRLGDKCNSSAFGPDWAIVELKEHVVGAPYYAVLNAEKVGMSNDDYSALKGTKVVVTSALNSNFKKDGVLLNVPTLCDGQLDHFLSEEDGPRAQYRQGTGCSNGDGNSGGGVVVPMGSQRPAIIGVMTGSMGDGYDFYNESKNNFSGGPLIEGNLAKLLDSCAQKCPPVSKSVSN